MLLPSVWVAVVVVGLALSNSSLSCHLHWGVQLSTVTNIWWRGAV